MEMINRSGNKGPSILLVDNDASFRATTKKALEDRGLRVLDASNGQEATVILGSNEVQLVLSDVEMPVMHGIDLLKYVKDTWPHIPVMLMTGMKDMIALQDAYKIGVEGFINKPFSTKELEDNIKEILDIKFKPNDEIPVQNLENEYTCFPIDEFLTGNNIKLPIYLKLSDKKIVKVANKGEDLSLLMIARLKKKGIEHLYVLKHEVYDFLETSTRISVEVGKVSSISKERKAKVYGESLKHLLKFSTQENFDEVIVTIVKKNIELLVDLFTQDEESFAVFEELSKNSGDIYAHSINVCMVSTLMARTMGWTSSEKLFLVSSAAVLHDIGLLEIDKELWSKPYEEMTSNEKSEYETHPIRGAAVVKRLKTLPEGLSQIILQHHEHADGSGYPYEMARANIHAVARIIHLADAFCHEWEEMADEGSPPTARRSYSKLLEKMQHFDGEFLLALNKAINMEYRTS